jgi:hypothetical protein
MRPVISRAQQKLLEKGVSEEVAWKITSLGRVVTETCLKDIEEIND